MRLHRLLAVLVIALSFNVAASKDARAAFGCHDFLSAHDNDEKSLQKGYMIYARGFYEGFLLGRKHEHGFKKKILDPSMIDMETTEIYYNILEYCRKEPSSSFRAKLYHFWLEKDFMVEELIQG